MNAALRITYDTEVDALYLGLREGIAAETIEVEESVYIDVDGDGRPLGIEFVNAHDFLPFLARHGDEFVIPERLDEPEALRLASA